MQTNSQKVLNALPTVLAYPALLAGYQTVDEAMSDQLFSNYVSAFIQQDVVAPIADTQNDETALSHQPINSSDSLAQLCSDGVMILPTLLLPNLLQLLATNGDIHRMAFLIAAYSHWLCAHAAEKEPIDEALAHGDWSKINNHDVVAFLSISPFESARLHTYSHFVAMYKSYRAQIAQYGVIFLLKQMAYNRLLA